MNGKIWLVKKDNHRLPADFQANILTSLDPWMTIPLDEVTMDVMLRKAIEIGCSVTSFSSSIITWIVFLRPEVIVGVEVSTRPDLFTTPDDTWMLWELRG